MAPIRKAGNEPLEIWAERLDRGEIPPVFFLYGDDEGRVLSFVKHLRHRCLEGAVAEFNESLFDARETPVESILEAARTLPVLCARRLVLVRNASSLTQRDWDKVLPYLETPSSSTCLVFRGGEKKPGSQKVLQAIRSQGAILEFRPRSQRDASEWVSAQLQLEQKRILPEAVAALLERVGTREGDLKGEIAKLLAYVGDSATVREEDVWEVAAEARTHRIFDLMDAITEHRTVEALKMLHRLLDEGASPLALMGMLARQVRLLWVARDNLSRRRGRAAWTGLNVPPFFRERLLKQARNWNETTLRRAIEDLVRLDRALKGGRLSPQILLDGWVINMANARARRTATKAR